MRLLVLSLALFVTHQAAQPAPPDNVTRARAVLATLAARDAATIEAQFTDRMRAAWPPERIRDIADFIKR